MLGRRTFPLPLPRDDPRRVADILASQSERIGARRNAVFFTPIRSALNSADHPSATAEPHVLHFP